MKLTGNSRLAAFGIALVAGVVSASAQVTASSTTVITKALGSATGLAVDQLGNLYAADGANNALLSLQGSNLAPISVLTGLAAPQQIAVDSSRNVYIANGTSNQVIEIPYQSGALNLNGTILLGKNLGTVVGVAVDLAGNVYASDATNKQVVKILGTTQTTVLSGLGAPRQVAIDRLGNLYVADSGANTVVELPAGGVATPVGTGLNAPAGVAVDQVNNLYIADTANGRVVEITTGGTQTTLTSGISAPTAVSTDTRGGVYIASGTSILRYTGGTNIYFGLLPVGTTSQTFPITLTFTAAVAPATIKVVTTGIVGLDYKDAGGDTCVAGGSYGPGSTCVVNVTFTPGTVGPRAGAIVMYASNNQVLARLYLGGGGMGALLTSDPGTVVNVNPTNITGGGLFPTVTTPRGLTVDAAGNIFLAEYGNGTTIPGRVTEVPASVITGYSINASGVATFYGSNSFVAGQVLNLSGFPKSTFLNPPNLGTVTVLVTGLSNTQFQVNVPAADDNLSATEPGFALGQAFVVANVGTNGVTINGAGDIVIFSGGATITLLPNENGTLNPTDISTLATGYSRARTGRADVAGNLFWCDAGANAMWELAAGTTTPVSLPYNKYSTGCLGSTVDLYGNLAFADSSNGKALYVPISGVTPYETGSGYTSAWGIAFDPSGSVWESASGANVLGRIPNENGTLVGADQILSTAGAQKDFDIYVDGNANVYTSQDTATTVSTFNIIVRSTTPLTFPISPTTGTPIGSTNATIENAFVSNSGNLPNVYVAPGTNSLYDSDDFPQRVPAAGNQCAFGLPLVPGFTCNLAFNFTPTSSGTRTETLQFTSNAVSTPYINLTGTAVMTAPSGTATLAVALTNPTGSPSPGQALTLTATATSSGTSTPTGSITFYVDSKPLGSAELTSGGTATYSIPAGLALGTHTIGITYAGDKNTAPVTAAVTSSITVVLATSTVNLISSGNEVAVNQAAIFTATIPTGTGLAVPTGSVVFTDTTNSATIGTGTVNSAGVASVSTTTLALGTHTIVATYSGNGVYATSKSSPVSVTVGNYTTTTTTLVVTPTQPTAGYTYGQAISASVTVAPTSGTGTPTGTANFSLDGTPTGVALSGAKATLSLTNVSAGTHILTVYYSGDSTYASSTSTTYTFSVIKAVTTTTFSTSTTADFASQAVTLTATVSSSTSVPTGTVNFLVGASVVGSATLSKGVATLVTTLLPAGADNITAVYVGDANDATSVSSPILVTVTLVTSTLNITAAPSVVLSGTTSSLSAILSAPIAANYAGTITFYSGATSLGSATVSSSGVASITTPALTAASNSFTAVYSGSAVFTASTTATPALVYVTNAGGAGVIATSSLGTGLSSASGVAVDISGNVYIDDATKGAIDLIAGGAGAQTVVTSGITSSGGVAVDGQGNLYIANGTPGHVTEILSQSGVLVLSTAKQLGTGLGTIVGVAVDNAGNVYASDATNKQVVKINGTAQSVLLTSANLSNPRQVAADNNGNVYVADGTSNHVVYVTSAGVVSNVGSGFVNPTGVAVDPYGNLYVSDTGNNRVVKIVVVGGFLSSQLVAIPSVAAPGQLAVDRHLAFYISQGTAIYKWQSGSASMGVIPPGVTSPAYTLTFTMQNAITPAAIKVLTQGVTGGDFAMGEGGTCAAGTAYAVGATCTVQVTFSPTLAGIRPGAVVFTTAAGQPLVTSYLGGVGYAAQLNFDLDPTPATVAVASTVLGGTGPSSALRGFTTDPAGNVYVCDNTNSRVFEVNAAGTVGQVLYVGTGCSSLALDGAGNVLIDNTTNVLLLPNENGVINGNDAYIVATGFAGSRGMGFDGFGNVVVADTTNIRVLISPIGQGTTGQIVPPLTLKSAYDAAMDWQGNIAVADSTAASIAYLSAASGVQTAIGPTLCAPYGLSMDAGGNVYVTESSVPGTSTPCVGISTSGNDVLRVSPSTPGFYNQVVAHASGPQGLYIDNKGNLYTNYSSGIVELNRTAISLNFASTIVGNSSAAATALISDGGPAPATFTAPSGVFYLDSADFSSGSTGNSSCATSAAQFISGYSCTLQFNFLPIQAGVRTAEYAPLSNSAYTPLVTLTGTGTGGSAATSTTIGLTLTTPKSGTGTPYQSITLTSALAGSGCTGTVTLQIDGAFYGVQTAAATNAFTIPGGVSPGFHTGLATYSGSSSCNPSTGTLFFSAAGATATSTVLTLSANTIVQFQTTPLATTPLVFTIKVTGSATGAIPTGSVLLLDGTTVIGTAPVSATGNATFTTTALLIGSHNLTADYAGDATYGTSVSPVQVVTVIYPGDYSLAITPNPVTVTVGTVASLTLTATPSLTALGGAYSGGIGISCTGLPIYATCSFAPSTINLDGTGTAMTSVMSIITETNFADNRSPFEASGIRFAWLPAGSLFLLLGAAGLRRRRKLLLSTRVMSIALLAALGLMLSGLTACGSHAALATPAGTYTVTINGQGQGNINHSITLQVTLHK